MTAERGEKWETWRALLADWIASQSLNLDHKLAAAVWFVTAYLPILSEPENPADLFREAEEKNLPDIWGLLTDRLSNNKAAMYQNQIFVFIEWVIANHFSESDDRGRQVPLVKNPFIKAKRKSLINETVHNPLPYTYVRELRQILCPKPRGNFSDWTWAQEQQAQQRPDPDGPPILNTGEWFEVDPNQIDQKDPDCVWRIRNVIRRQKGSRQRQYQIYEIWSPARAMVLFVKLHIPLRTYQVRFLDSGEADTWRYEQGAWQLNKKHLFKLGSEKNPFNRGVFCRLRSPDTEEFMTGLYINTNKTADQNKDERERGYTIPWQNENLLYWLEKLRNWQEKYNPVSNSTSCSELEKKHIGHTKSQIQLREMGSICFLFRDASAGKKADRKKPIPMSPIFVMWYRLLSELEIQVAARGQALSDGSPLRFVSSYPEDYIMPKTGVEFPLHSLRVSLLTCYAMEGQVPLPVLSKLLAGHSRLLMTLYYVKPTPSMMSQAMDQATSKVEAAQEQSLRIFLRDADLHQIICKTAFRDEVSLESALNNRNSVGWEYRHIGLCLVGGNTVKSSEVKSVGGCWNGGDLQAIISGSAQYDAVPHGPENCVRCRWFITDARYLDALRAHFNNISYRASLAANLALEHEQARDALLDERFRCCENGQVFTRQTKLQEAERRYERQIVEADEYAKDLVACFQLIGRLVAIEKSRNDSDKGTKLVAVGSMQDIHQPISIIETNSEMLQLAQICEDAELYPDLLDDLRKTPVLEKRSRALNRVLMKKGYSPVFMEMDERMQLIAGNAMMRAMAAQASPNDQFEGFRHVSGLLETGKNLHLLTSGIAALEDAYQGPVIKLSELLGTSKHSQGLING